MSRLEAGVIEFTPEPPASPVKLSIRRPIPIDLAAERAKARAYREGRDDGRPRFSHWRLAAAIFIGIAGATVVATAAIDFLASRCAWPGVYCEAAFDPSRLDTY